MSRIRANTIVNGAGTGAPNFPRGAIISGISTINAEISVGTGTSISSPATNELALGTNNTEKVRITSGGLVGINTNNPQKTLHVNSSADNSFGIVRISGKNRGGQLEFCTDATKTAGIYSPTSSNELVFFTSSSETERLRITSGGEVQIANGNLKFSTAGTGIDFSATSDGSGTATSEVLDDYEEGTWTPTASTGTISAGDASYIKIGGYVFISGYVTFADATTTSDVIINNIPFVANYRASGAVFSRYTDAGKIPNAVYANPSTTSMYFYVSGAGAASYFALEHDELASTQNQFFFSLGYRTNS